MNGIEALKKLIDEDAITFLKANERNIDAQFNSYLEMNNAVHINGKGYAFGIDLAGGSDMTVCTPPYRKSE